MKVLDRLRAAWGALVKATDPPHWPETWGNAGPPLPPTAPVGYGARVDNELEQPVIFEYPWGANLVATPRSGFSLLSFAQLRSLADGCQEIRLPIELLKREVRALEWQITGEGDTDAARAWLLEPDGTTAFDVWLNMLLEELLVTDAVTIYPGLTRAGEIGALELIDGATIRPLLDARGRVAVPPLPAYAQVVREMPVGQWTRDELWYLPFSTRVATPYGKSPVELVILSVNTALRRSTTRLGQYTEGNIPEALVGLPAEWTVNDIQAFQTYWDALLAADQQKLARIKFFPVGSSSIPVHEFQRTTADSTVLDEWLLKIGCWAVGVTPAEFGLVPGDGLGGSGFASEQAEIMHRIGLGPISQYLKLLFDTALALRFPRTTFEWVTLQTLDDRLKQAQLDQIRLGDGVYDLAYVQEREGIPEENRPDAAPAQPSGLFGLAAGGEPGPGRDFFQTSWHGYG